MFSILIVWFLMDKVVGGKYRIGRKIGSGSFGEIYIGMNYKKLYFILHV